MVDSDSNSESSTPRAKKSGRRPFLEAELSSSETQDLDDELEGAFRVEDALKWLLVSVDPQSVAATAWRVTFQERRKLLSTSSSTVARYSNFSHVSMS